MPHWRDMTTSDLDAVYRIAAIVHPDFPEDDAVLAEKLALYPDGCLVLEDEVGITGYVFSHPYPFGQSPALNTRLVALSDADGCYYLHDIALLPEARGNGAATRAVTMIMDRARDIGFDRIALTAVSYAITYWTKMGFASEDGTDPDSYGADALYMSRML